MAGGLGFLQAGIGGLQAILGASALKQSKKEADQAIAALETKEVDPLIAQRLNAPMPGEQEASMDIGQTETQALSAAKTRKGGLASITGVQAQTNKAKQGLAVKKAGYKLGAEQALVGERNAALKSRQEKQGLVINTKLAQVGADRSMISQGLSGIGAGVGNAMYAGGKLSDITGGIGKGFNFLGGLFRGKDNSYSSTGQGE